MPATPTIFEWVALIQHDPAQARKHLIAIKARNKIQGLLADLLLTISVEEYDEAQHLLVAAADDPAASQRAAHMAQLGQALIEPYPDRDAWQALVAADPAFAREVCAALQGCHAGPAGAAGAAAQHRSLPRARRGAAAVTQTCTGDRADILPQFGAKHRSIEPRRREDTKS